MHSSAISSRASSSAKQQLCNHPFRVSSEILGRASLTFLENSWRIVGGQREYCALSLVQAVLEIAIAHREYSPVMVGAIGFETTRALSQSPTEFLVNRPATRRPAGNTVVCGGGPHKGLVVVPQNPQQRLAPSFLRVATERQTDARVLVKRPLDDTLASDRLKRTMLTFESKRRTQRPPSLLGVALNITKERRSMAWIPSTETDSWSSDSKERQKATGRSTP